MLNETDHQAAFDLSETVRALEFVLSDCGGPEYNNPERLDLTALKRAIDLINRSLTQATESAIGRLNLYKSLQSRSVRDEVTISRLEAFLETVGGNHAKI